jgi:hypothetical protein
MLRKRQSLHLYFNKNLDTEETASVGCIILHSFSRKNKHALFKKILKKTTKHGTLRKHEISEHAKWQPSLYYFTLISVRTEYSQIASERSLIQCRTDPLDVFSPADTASLSTATQGALESTVCVYFPDLTVLVLHSHAQI